MILEFHMKEHINLQKWQFSEIQKGIQEADAGHLIDHEKVVEQWKRLHNKLRDCNFVARNMPQAST